MKPTKKDKATVERIVIRAIEDAEDFIEEDVAPDWLKAQRYFNGECDLAYEEGRSSVIVTKCRDVVRAVKPSLMRVFFATERPVEFIPRTPQDVDAAEQATEYVQWTYNRNDGFRLLTGAVHDALVKKVGILKAYYEEKQTVEIDHYTNLLSEVWALIEAEPDVEILEQEETEAGINGKVARTKTGGDISIRAVAPEDFFIDSQATSIRDFYVCGDRVEMRVGDLVDMGFDFEEVAELGKSEDDTGEQADFERKGYYDENDEDETLDPSMRPVTVWQAYMKMDIEGTGAPRLYSFIVAGEKKKLLEYELCDYVPYAVFEVDPEPHSFFGKSLVDLVLNDQDAATSMMRGLLDNIAASNTPGIAFNDDVVKIEDLMNKEIGALVRVKGTPTSAIMPFEVPFTAGHTLAAMQYFNEEIENKTGVTRAAIGLNPDALQSTTAAGVNATVAAAEGQAEVIARNLAEGGMRQLFTLLLKLTRAHASREQMINLRGRFVPVNPASWNAEMDCVVNVGIGTNRREERAIALRETLQNQIMAWTNYGPNNGLVTLTQIRNTLADILKLSGIHDANRYWMPMDRQLEQLLMQQAAQAAQQMAQQSDPAQVMAQAEVQKAQISAQAKMQSDAAKAKQDFAIEAAKMQMDAQRTNRDDDFRRDQMAQELALRAAEILGKHQVAVNTAAVQAEQAKPREQQ